MDYTVTVPPVLQAVDLATAKEHLRVLDNEEDGMIQAYLDAAIFEAEGYLSRALITQTLKLQLDCFPSGREIELLRPPVQSVTSVKYYDEAGDLQTFDSAGYHVDATSEPGRIRLKGEYDWPTTQDGRPGAVEVTFVAGYGDTPLDVPAMIRQGILFLVAHFFSMRQPIEAGISVNSVPMSATWCFDAKRFVTFS